MTAFAHKFVEKPLSFPQKLHNFIKQTLRNVFQNLAENKFLSFNPNSSMQHLIL